MATKTALILLTAGASRRMGRLKQLPALQNDPAVLVCLRRILTAGIGRVVVVVGHKRSSILPLLERLPISTVVDPLPESRMADSVKVGLAALPPGVTGIMIALADHPLVQPATYQVLRKQHELHGDRIIIPTYHDLGGHPTLFPASLLYPMEHPKPLNRIIDDNPEKIVQTAVEDPGVVLDMDYFQDYIRLAALAGEPRKATTESIFE